MNSKFRCTDEFLILQTEESHENSMLTVTLEGDETPLKEIPFIVPDVVRNFNFISSLCTLSNGRCEIFEIKDNGHNTGVNMLFMSALIFPLHFPMILSKSSNFMFKTLEIAMNILDIGSTFDVRQLVLSPSSTLNHNLEHGFIIFTTGLGWKSCKLTFLSNPLLSLLDDQS